MVEMCTNGPFDKHNHTLLSLQGSFSQKRSKFPKRLTDSHHFPKEDGAAGRQCAGEAQELGKHVSQSQVMRQLDTSQHGSHLGDPGAWGQMRKPDEAALTQQRRGLFFSPVKPKSS